MYLQSSQVWFFAHNLGKTIVGVGRVVGLSWLCSNEICPGPTYIPNYLLENYDF
jgi:hypothetical protein